MKVVFPYGVKGSYTRRVQKAEPEETEKLATRLDESAFSGFSESRVFPQYSLGRAEKNPRCVPIKSLSDGSVGSATIESQEVQ